MHRVEITFNPETSSWAWELFAPNPKAKHFKWRHKKEGYFNGLSFNHPDEELVCHFLAYHRLPDVPWENHDFVIVREVEPCKLY